MRLQHWIDRLIPASCLLCGAAAEGPLDICGACAPELPWLAPGCRRCALPLHGGPAPMCGHCLATPPCFAGCLAAFAYTYPVRELILRFKQGGDLAAGRLLAGLLVERLRRAPALPLAGTVLLPMPLHSRRLADRGFNQAERIGRELARALSLPLEQSLARRALHTREQKQLGAAARHANLHHAFRAGHCAGRHIVIVDDVLTTGATADALARTLLAAGAAEVRVWCLARAL